MGYAPSNCITQSHGSTCDQRTFGSQIVKETFRAVFCLGAMWPAKIHWRILRSPTQEQTKASSPPHSAFCDRSTAISGQIQPRACSRSDWISANGRPGLRSFSNPMGRSVRFSAASKVDQRQSSAWIFPLQLLVDANRIFSYPAFSHHEPHLGTTRMRNARGLHRGPSTPRPPDIMRGWGSRYCARVVRHEETVAPIALRAAVFITMAARGHSAGHGGRA